jgi:phenylalanyl-tRNA synthetase alpha chain
MIENINRIRQEAEVQIASAPSPQELDKLRVHYLGKKGLLTGLLHQLKALTPEQRKEMGAVLNEVKGTLETNLFSREKELQKVLVEKELASTPMIDVTLPGFYPIAQGSLHPITKVSHQLVQVLRRVGYSFVSGPEIELEYYNFEALNTPEHHPARDLQDTFYVAPGILLRSHTSPVQIRAMKTKAPPLQIMTIGKVYRSDYDATHTPMFHQLEGLMIGTDISLADLKGVLHHLVRNLFGNRPLRFRPSYFPFTEPSAEVDMQCFQCKGSGKECRLCGSTGWIEIGGCGMVHPNVFKAVGYDADETSGFAFGMGVERISMLKHGMDDLRALFENDYRMLEQF